MHSRHYDKRPLRHNDIIIWCVCLTVQVHTIVRIPQLTRSFYLGLYHFRLMCELHFQLGHWEPMTLSAWLRVLSIRRHYLWVAALVIGCAPEMIFARSMTTQLGLWFWNNPHSDGSNFCNIYLYILYII